MILYRPTDGDVQITPTAIRSQTCFLMTKLGDSVPETCQTIRSDVQRILAEQSIDWIDANSATTGRDFLQKIWDLIVSVPMGIAIIYKEMPPETLANIFFELGWMQALGKETLLVTTGDVVIPSDFVRTEYVVYDQRFEERLNNFIQSVQERGEYLAIVAEQVENNPLLAIDYYRRAYLISGDDELKHRALGVVEGAGLGKRARNSVEMLLAGFARPNQTRPPVRVRREIAATEDR